MNHLINILGSMSLIMMVGCRPAQMDPPFNFSHHREDAKVDTLQFLPEHPLNTMGVPTLWKKTTGKFIDGKRVVIAVVGTGIDYRIPDLRDALWINVGEFDEGKRSDKRDNDKNGTRDDVIGYDFYSGDPWPYDRHGHDTFTASLIAATARHNVSVVGVAPNASLLIARYISSDGEGSGFDAVAALEYAIINKAQVIYFNWPQGGFSLEETQIVLQTLQEVAAKNVLVVLPAGNGKNLDIPRFVREAAKLPNVLVVSGTDQNGKLTPWTNRGKNLAALAAPSVGAVGYFPGGEVSSGLQTTSVAAAYVAGAAGLLFTLPHYAQAEKVKRALLQQANRSKAEAELDVLAGGILYLAKIE